MLEDLDGKPGLIVILGGLKYFYQEERGPIHSNIIDSHWQCSASYSRELKLNSKPFRIHFKQSCLICIQLFRSTCFFCLFQLQFMTLMRCRDQTMWLELPTFIKSYISIDKITRFCMSFCQTGTRLTSMYLSHLHLVFSCHLLCCFLSLTFSLF